ncbi:UDP-N-acetylmuramate--L-alanine ligase [Patescibacteria group bacterium]|nr:UDP-N-acetylmuramate--L-alanine ligase [Patescibacteria group bacterium]
MILFKKVYFIGIGGVSMSGLAKVMLAMDKEVAGSDLDDKKGLDELRELGVKVNIGHDAGNIDDDIDLVVMTGAIEDDNPELVEARRLNIPVWRRMQLVGFLMRDKVGVAVSGMHGKTTVTSMIAAILEKAGENPTILGGSYIKEIGSNAKYGDSDLVVAEACEYQRAFLDLEPQILVMTNIEEEHMDTYKDLRDIFETFTMFANKVPIDGMLVGCLDDKNVLKLMRGKKANLVGYGFGRKPKSFAGVYWRIKNYRSDDGLVGFEVALDDEELGTSFSLRIPGKFNVLNAVAAVIVADFLLVDVQTAAEILAEFTGASRRFEIKGEKDGVVVIDDYGHHPTEIKNTIEGIREFYPKKDLWIVFWPHQYERTMNFFDEFVNCFEGVERLIVLDIYEARKAKIDKSQVNSKKLVEAIKSKKGIHVSYVPEWKEAYELMKKEINKDMVLLTLGAAPIDVLADKFLE